MSERTVMAKSVDAKTITRTFDKGVFPKTLQIDGDLAANTIPVMLVGIDGNLDTPATQDGAVLVFSATNTIITFYGPCSIGCVKGITANAVGMRIVEIG